VRTIAVPAFQNETAQFKIEQSLTGAVIHEFLARTSYRMQSQEEGSDAVLRGVVTSLYAGPIVFSGRTTEVLMTVNLRVTLLDTRTQRILYEANDWVFRESYEVSADPRTYFAENEPAVERLSRQVASSLVTTLLESF